MNTTIRFTSARGLIATAVLAALAAGISANSLAADSPQAPQVVVSYGDLNLASPQAAAALYSRIVGAARQVCGYVPHTRSPAEQQAASACIHKSIMDAVTKVGQPELIAIYNSKNHQPLPITVAVIHTP